MAERPAAARSRSVGRCDLLVEVAKSQLGPLWVATTPGALGLEPRLVRCLTLAAPGVTSDDRAVIAEVGRWSRGFEAEQAASTLEVVVEGNDLALVSAYVPGETLRSLLRLVHFKRSSLPTRVALRVVRDVCEALLAAESRAASAPGGPVSLWGGLLPDSILVGVDGTTRVLELGVASLWRQRSSEAQHPEVTAYCAPERLDQSIVDARADVFVLGILLWEMLSGGKRLFLGSSQRAVVEKLRKHDVVAAGSDLPADSMDAATRALLNQMLAQDPGNRFGGVLELKQALEAMGDAVALPRELSDFVTNIAASSLDSRERVLARTLERGADRRVQPAPAAPDVVAPERLRPSTVKPLPLPAQTKLGRLSAPDGLVPPPLRLAVPAEVMWLATADAEAGIEVEETGSVRAEDIMAALAVEDAEPESDAAPGQRSPDAAPAVVDATLATTPPSSGRRASPTAVVVPSVVAAPDAEAFAPVPSVLQTLRGPGIPPPTFDFLPPLEFPPGAGSTLRRPAAQAPLAPAPLLSAGTGPTDAAERPQASSIEPAQPLPAVSASAARLHTPSRGLSRLRDQRLPVPMVAALSGAAFVVVMGLVFALGNGDTESRAERVPEVMGASTSDSEQTGSHVPEQAPGAARAGAAMAKPALAADEAAREGDATQKNANESEAATAEDEARPENAAHPQTGSAEAEAAEAAPAEPARTVRVTPAPARVKRSSGALRTTAKKKKLRATRTYIPAGI